MEESTVRLLYNAQSHTRVHDRYQDTSESTRNHGYLSETSSCSKTTRAQALSISYNSIRSGGSCSLGSILCPSLSSGQNVFLNRPAGSYFFLSATRRSQFSPKEAATRAGGSCLPRNCAFAPLRLRILTLHHEKLPYRGKRPTARHRLNSISEPLCHRWRGKENNVISGGRGEAEKVLRLRL